MPSCGWCRDNFRADENLRQHQKSTGHLFCQPCDRYFSQLVDLQNHRPDCRGLKCAVCNNHFGTKKAIRRHQKSSGHCYCGDCGRFFEGSDSLTEHQRTAQHASEFRCCDCNRTFKTSKALKQHLENKVHKPPPSSSAHECVECKRQFKNEHALRQHRLSVAHRPISNLRCIGKGGCKRRFKCPSAMMQHLESGTCSSGMTRERLNTLILTNDCDRIISGADGTPQGLLLEAMKRLNEGASVGSASSSTTSGSVILTPPSGLTSASHTPLTQHPPLFGGEAMGMAIARGSPTRCPLCPPNRKPFRTEAALRHHMDSPAHAPLIFNCPAALSQPPKGASPASGKTHLKRFSTISGLTAHVESGACRGGKASLQKAVAYVEARLRDIGVDAKLIM